MSKLLVFDLETTHLKANMGHILTAAAKYVGQKKIYKWRIDNTPGYGKTPRSYCDDSMIVKGLVELIDESDATIAHYGERFDEPFLTTRCLANGIAIPAPHKLLDTWKYMKKRLALTSNRLETAAQFFGGPQKSKLPLHVWQYASHGDRKILNQMQAYNVDDVLALEGVYLKMRPLITDHPHIGGEGCPACGDLQVQHRGFRRTKLFKIQRMHCQECGTWFDGTRTREGKK